MSPDKLRRVKEIRAERNCSIQIAKKVVERQDLRAAIAKADSFHDIRMILLGVFPEIGEE